MPRYCLLDLFPAELLHTQVDASRDRILKDPAGNGRKYTRNMEAVFPRENSVPGTVRFLEFPVTGNMQELHSKKNRFFPKPLKKVL